MPAFLAASFIWRRACPETSEDEEQCAHTRGPRKTLNDLIVCSVSFQLAFQHVGQSSAQRLLEELSNVVGP